MKPVLILYATRHGQTRRIADYLVAQMHARGLPANLLDAAQLPGELALDAYSGAILCASVHLGRHEKEMVEFVQRHREGLRNLPSAFVSVSLSQAGVQDPAWTAERRAQAADDTHRLIEEFVAKTGWRPHHVQAVAGALRFTQYNWLVRIMMKRIARQAGVPNDPSRDYEFTDWTALDHLVAEVVGDVRSATRAQTIR